MKKQVLSFLSVIVIQLCAGHSVFADKIDDRTDASMGSPLSSVSATLLSSFNNASNVTSTVNMYTGKADISIPLHVIQIDGISIPIALTYHTGGLKVTDVAGTVGLGWNLFTGGKIGRSLSGANGDFDNAYGMHSAGYIKGLGDLPETVDKHIKELVKKENYDKNLSYSPIMEYWYQYFEDRDTRPDMFYYELPNTSGMFMFGRDREGYGFPYQFFHINSLNLSGTQLKISDDNGYDYYFGATQDENDHVEESGLEKTKYYSINSTIATTWHLRKIVKDGRTIATFNYISGEEYSYQVDGFYHVVEFKDHKFNTHWKRPLNYNTVVYYPKYLSSITTEHEEITFHYNSELRKDGFHDPNYGKDYFIGMTLLEKIEIKVNNEKFKTLNFNYGSFAVNNYPKLQSIDEQIKNTKPEKVYSFVYEESVNLPRWNSLSFDYWGYYNGMNDTGMTGYNRPSSFVWYDSKEKVTYTFNGTVSRESSFAHTKANSLTKINYKGGGSKEYEYEPHETSDGKPVGGLRVKSVTDYDEHRKVVSNVRYEYNDLSTGKSSGRCFSYPEATAVYYAEDGNKDYFISHEHYPFQLEDYDGSAIVYPSAQEIYLNGSYKNVRFYSFDDYQDIKATIREIGSHHWSSPKTEDYRHVPSTSYWWARGMEKVVELYNASNGLERKDSLVYELEANPRAKFVDWMPFISLAGQYKYRGDGKQYTYNLFKMSEHYWVSQAVRLRKHIVEKGRGNFANETIMQYSVRHSEPTTIYNTNGTDTIKTVIRYPFSYELWDTFDGGIEQDAMKAMAAKGIKIPVEKYVQFNDKVVSAQVSTFKQIKGINNKVIIRPWKSYSLAVESPIKDYKPAYFAYETFYCDSRCVHGQSAEHYDSKGNVTNIISPFAGTNSSYMYDKFSNIIASIDNAVYAPLADSRENQVYYTSFEYDNTLSGAVKSNLAKTGNVVMSQQLLIDLSHFTPGLYKLSYWKSMDHGQTWEKVVQNLEIDSGSVDHIIGENKNLDYWIDEIRLIPVNATITTYTFLVGCGKSSQMDHNGRTQYWEYDDKCRLSRLLNNDREILQEYEYHTVNAIND